MRKLLWLRSLLWLLVSVLIVVFIGTVIEFSYRKNSCASGRSRLIVRGGHDLNCEEEAP